MTKMIKSLAILHKKRSLIMANTYAGSIGLRGSNGRVSTLHFDLGVFDGADPTVNYGLAWAALDQIRGALSAITAATVASVRLIELVAASESVPSSEDARVYVKAAVVCHLNAPGSVGKFVTVFVPAPVDGIFVGDEGDGEAEDVVDVNDAALQQYIQQLAQHAFVSDGEQINTSAGSGGIRSGRRISRGIPAPGQG